MLLTITDLTKRYGKKTVLDNISLELRNKYSARRERRGQDHSYEHTFYGHTADIRRGKT